MADEELSVTVRLHDPDAEPERLDELTMAVREDLLGIATSVTRGPGEPLPPGALGAADLAIGALTVVISASPVLLRSVVGILRAWRETRPERSVRIQVGEKELKLGHATRAQQERLVDAFIDEVHPGE